MKRIRVETSVTISLRFRHDCNFVIIRCYSNHNVRAGVWARCGCCLSQSQYHTCICCNEFRLDRRLSSVPMSKRVKARKLMVLSLFYFSVLAGFPARVARPALQAFTGGFQTGFSVTPVLSSGGTPSITYTVQSGYAIKLKGLVFYSFAMRGTVLPESIETAKCLEFPTFSYNLSGEISARPLQPKSHQKRESFSPK